MFQKTAVFAFLPFLQINDHDQLVLWSILNFFDKSGYKWACQFWWCICSELFVNSKVAHPDGSVILINDNIISSISPPSIFLFNIMTPSVLCLGMAVAVQFFLWSSSSSCPDNLNQRNHLYHHRPYICHHIGRAKVLTPLVMIAKSFIDSQVRGIHSVSPRRLSE